MRICVITYYTIDIVDYFKITRKLNEMYCKKNKIDFVISSTPNYKNRTPHWERIPLILNVLNSNKYDWVVWIDADAFFYYDSPNIKTLIHKNLDKDFIFSEDANPQWWPINSGLFVVKNTTTSKQFLNAWGFDEEKYESSLNKTHWVGNASLNMHDQELLNTLYEDNFLNVKNKSVIIPYGEMQMFTFVKNNNKPYVFHMAGQDKAERIIQAHAYLLTQINITLAANKTISRQQYFKKMF